MAKRKRSSEQARATILTAADTVLREYSAAGVTVEAVAKRAGCAKGLVLYHFKTKRGLLEATARELARTREQRWQTALAESHSMAAVDATWKLLTEESTSGVLRAWTSVVGPGGYIPDQVVSELHASFARVLGKAAAGMLSQVGLEPRIPQSEIGWLLASVANGMGLSLIGGGDSDRLSGAYAAAWLGVLSLTRQPA